MKKSEAEGKVEVFIGMGNWKEKRKWLKGLEISLFSSDQQVILAGENNCKYLCKNFEHDIKFYLFDLDQKK